MVFNELIRDEYRYMEIQAPMGYTSDNVIGTAKKDGVIHTATVKNSGKGVMLPNSGGTGTHLPEALGIMLITAAFAGLCWRKPRHERGCR